MRYAAKVDVVHRAIVDTLRQCGWRVAETHRLPGFVDAVASKGDMTRLIEIKSGNEPLTDSQRKLIQDGHPVYVLRCPEDALSLHMLAPEEGERWA